jgi:hypothetical protein
MEGVQRRRQLTTGLLAAVAAAASDWGYLAVIHSQNAQPPYPGVVPFITGYVGMAFVVAGRLAAAKSVFLSAAAGSAALGFLAIFSIGVALLITAALLTVAAKMIPPVRRRRSWLWPASGAFVAVAALIAGFVVVGTF